MTARRREAASYTRTARGGMVGAARMAYFCLPMNASSTVSAVVPLALLSITLAASSAMAQSLQSRAMQQARQPSIDRSKRRACSSTIPSSACA